MLAGEVWTDVDLTPWLDVFLPPVTDQRPCAVWRVTSRMLWCDTHERYLPEYQTRCARA